MPLSRLADFQLGKIDGKHEYVETSTESRLFFNTFLMPDTVNERQLLSGERFIIRGFRGTGKTSLLRWIAGKLRENDAAGQFVLFKSDLSESQRMEISRQTGLKWESPLTDKMEITQDFKESWRWFLHRKICEILQDNPDACTQNYELTQYRRLLGLGEIAWFEKIVGEFPKLEAAKIKIKSALNIGNFVEAEFGGELNSSHGSKAVPFSSVLRKLDSYLSKIIFKKTIYLCLDEMEVFFHSPEQYKRDLRMIRDLVFSAASLATFVKSRQLPLKIYVAVRSEVLDAIGSDGQEVSRIAIDCGFNIAWHHARRGLKHPLLNMVRRKIWASEVQYGLTPSADPILQYFPANVNGIAIDSFLLDQSFLKPRDIVLRLIVAQEQFPLKPYFDSVALSGVDNEYSLRMWEEMAYELSASYEVSEVKAIEELFFGRRATFKLEEVSERLLLMADSSIAARTIVNRRGIRNLLHDLFRIGAIGNLFYNGEDDSMQRWIFRGDPRLEETQGMVLHKALHKRLAISTGRSRNKTFSYMDSSRQQGEDGEVWGKRGTLTGRRTSHRDKRR